MSGQIQQFDNYCFEHMQLVRAFIKTFESVGIYSVIPLNLQLSSQNTESKSRAVQTESAACCNLK